MSRRLAAIGAGPSTIFLMREFIAHNSKRLSLDIYEAKNDVAVGMPYGEDGAEDEHMCNISCEEIPDLVHPVSEWIKNTADQDILDKFGIDRDNIDLQSPLPRILFGQYLKFEFDTLMRMAKENALEINLFKNTPIHDVQDLPEVGKVELLTAGGSRYMYDQVVISTGHVWPQEYEGQIKDYYDSPYPPKKLTSIFNRHVGVRGASLTAVDAIKTLAKTHGYFVDNNTGGLDYIPYEGTEKFKITMHSRQGVLPCPRIHFNHPVLSHNFYITEDEIACQLQNNAGFIALDYVFEKAFKLPLMKEDPDFYAVIKDMNVESFVDYTFSLRKSNQPFIAFENELKLSKASMETDEPIHWKEVIGFLNAALSVTTKHMPAEDVLRVRQLLMPLIANIIAYLPHDSSNELIALHKAGKLELIAVGPDSELTIDKNVSGAMIQYVDSAGHRKANSYEVFVDCIGQRQMPFEAFPFKGLVKNGSVASAIVEFQSSEKGMAAKERGYAVTKVDNLYHLKVPGIAINDNLQVVNKVGQPNPRIFITAVPQIGGQNPDFAGLDFCEYAGRKIFQKIATKSYSPI